MVGKTAADNFYATNAVPNYPPRHAVVVTPSDTADLGYVTKSIWVGGAGALAVIMADDINDSQSVTLSAVPVGTMLNIQVRRVMSTNTTATNIVALWG